MFKNKKILTVEILAVLLILVIVILYWNSDSKDSGFYQNLLESEKECIGSSSEAGLLEKIKAQGVYLNEKEAKIISRCMGIIKD